MPRHLLSFGDAQRPRRSADARNKPHVCSYHGCDASYYYSHDLRKHETAKHGRKPKPRFNLTQLVSQANQRSFPSNVTSPDDDPPLTTPTSYSCTFKEESSEEQQCCSSPDREQQVSDQEKEYSEPNSGIEAPNTNVEGGDISFTLPPTTLLEQDALSPDDNAAGSSRINVARRYKCNYREEFGFVDLAEGIPAPSP